jgi:hypothetical protein
VPGSTLLVEVVPREKQFKELKMLANASEE